MQWVAKMDLLPTVWSWQAAYIQAFNDIEETRGNESLSAAYADRLTEISQSANQAKDLSRIQAQKDEMTQWLTSQAARTFTLVQSTPTVTEQ